MIEGPCATRSGNYVSRLSPLFVAVRNLMRETYSIVDIFNKDLDAARSTMSFKQACEPSSNYGVPPLM